MPATAKKFVDEAFGFFERLSDDRTTYRPCSYQQWKVLEYRCITFKKKYTVAYLELENEVIICDFVLSKLLS